jgi:predicted dehydrogenase
MSLKGKTLGFVGAGAMGEALMKGLVEAGLVAPGAVHAFDPRADRMAELSQRYGIRWARSAPPWSAGLSSSPSRPGCPRTACARPWVAGPGSSA